jgi:hypothetical protein
MDITVLILVGAPMRADYKVAHKDAAPAFI